MNIKNENEQKIIKFLEGKLPFEINNTTFRRINLSDLMKPNTFDNNSIKNRIPFYDICNLNSSFEECALIEIALPGFSKEEITIKLEDNKLHIKALNPLDKTNYTKVQILTDYNFTINLEYPVEIISAKLKDGILSITVKKLNTIKNIVVE